MLLPAAEKIRDHKIMPGVEEDRTVGLKREKKNGEGKEREKKKKK